MGSVGELYNQSSSLALVPDFSMRTSLAYVWKEEARAPLIAPLGGTQRVKVCSTRSPMAWQHVLIGACRCAVWSSCTGKQQFFALLPDFSMRTSPACVWK